MEFIQTNLGGTGAVMRMVAICQAAIRRMWRSQKTRRTLLVRETAALGERRFVAVIECERQRFLIGASPGSVTLLARLADEDSAGQERA